MIILMEDPNNMRELIKQAIKVDNRIYQSKKAKRELGRLLLVYKSQAPRQV